MFADLVGKTITQIDGNVGGEQLTFHTADGSVYAMYHEQDCCELVLLADIVGDLADVIRIPIVRAIVATNTGKFGDGSATWTFYILQTAKGTVTIRWYGISNGYYSETVSFERVTE